MPFSERIFFFLLTMLRNHRISIKIALIVKKNGIKNFKNPFSISLLCLQLITKTVIFDRWYCETEVGRTSIYSMKKSLEIDMQTCQGKQKNIAKTIFSANHKSIDLRVPN